MKSRKMLVLILTVVFFVGSVGLGIHILHKDAKANAGITVWCHDNLDDPVEDVVISCEVWNDEPRLIGFTWEMEFTGTGVYYFEPEGVDQEDISVWIVEILDGATPSNPSWNPVNSTGQSLWLDWEVVPDP